MQVYSGRCVNRVIPTPVMTNNTRGFIILTVKMRPKTVNRSFIYVRLGLPHLLIEATGKTDFSVIGWSKEEKWFSEIAPFSIRTIARLPTNSSSIFSFTASINAPNDSSPVIGFNKNPFMNPQPIKTVQARIGSVKIAIRFNGFTRMS